MVGVLPTLCVTVHQKWYTLKVVVLSRKIETRFSNQFPKYFHATYAGIVFRKWIRNHWCDVHGNTEHTQRNIIHFTQAEMWYVHTYIRTWPAYIHTYLNKAIKCACCPRKPGISSWHVQSCIVKHVFHVIPHILVFCGWRALTTRNATGHMPLRYIHTYICTWQNKGTARIVHCKGWWGIAEKIWFHMSPTDLLAQSAPHKVTMPIWDESSDTGGRSYARCFVSAASIWDGWRARLFCLVHVLCSEVSGTLPRLAMWPLHSLSQWMRPAVSHLTPFQVNGSSS